MKRNRTNRGHPKFSSGINTCLAGQSRQDQLKIMGALIFLRINGCPELMSRLRQIASAASRLSDSLHLLRVAPFTCLGCLPFGFQDNLQAFYYFVYLLIIQGHGIKIVDTIFY